MTERISIIAILLIAASIVYFHNARDLELKIAREGWSPQDYVAHKLHPENFQRDWPSGILDQDQSLPWRVYWLLSKYFSISPTQAMYRMLFVQTLLFSISILFIVRILFECRSPMFITWILTLVLLSNMAGMNMGRLGNGYFTMLAVPYSWGFAISFGIFALGFYLQDSFLPYFVFLALTAYCHITLSLYILAFTWVNLLYKPGFFKERTFVKGAVLFLIMLAPLMASILLTSSIATGDLPADRWVLSTKIFSFHDYPLILNMFTTNAKMTFFPSLLLCLFFLVSLKYHDRKDPRIIKTLLGFAVCLIMSFMGVLFSDIHPSPFIIKLGLLRSTHLMTFFGILYLGFYLYKKIETGNIVVVFFSVIAYIALIASTPGIAVLPLSLIVMSDINKGHIGPFNMHSGQIKTAKRFYYITVASVLLLTIVSVLQFNIDTESLKPAVNKIFTNLWSPLQFFNPLRNFDFLLRGGSFKNGELFKYIVIVSCFTALGLVIFRSAKKKLAPLGRIAAILIMLSAIWYISDIHYHDWHDRHARIASSYLDVQLWARDNTLRNSLFISDPSQGYGWRDFSERSSFGSLREWGFTAVAYNPDFKVYQEGLNRMRAIGIDINEITEDDIENRETGIYGQKLAKQIQEVFYSMDAGQLKTLIAKYDIDYIVLQKKYYENKLTSFSLAYENDDYVVYKTTEL